MWGPNIFSISGADLGPWIWTGETSISLISDVVAAGDVDALCPEQDVRVEMLNQNSSSAHSEQHRIVDDTAVLVAENDVAGRPAWWGPRCGTSRVISMFTKSAASGPLTWIWRSHATSHMLTCSVRYLYSSISPPSSGLTYARGWYTWLYVVYAQQPAAFARCHHERLPHARRDKHLGIAVSALT